jgi:FkbM family methyltransferase
VIYETPEHPRFTDWVVRSGYLREPFRLIDAGVQGGIHRRWLWFADQLEVFAFDPLQQVINDLKAANRDPTRFHYFHIGLGNEDGERLFEQTPNPYGSAFLPPVMTEDAISRTASGQIPSNWTKVRIRKLDTLLASGLIPVPDAMKMDCEGFEVEILKGASTLLSKRSVFAIESESNLKLHPWHSPCHFVDLYRLVGPLGFDVYDLYYYRTPVEDIAKPNVGPPDTFDFLFLRELKDTASVDAFLKMAMLAELYALPDVALRILKRNRVAIRRRLDVDKAEELLRA